MPAFSRYESSTLAFGRPFYKGGLVNRRAVLKSSYAQFVYLLQGADEDSMDRMRDYLKTLCAGWSVQQVNEIVAETLHELIDALVYAEAVALFEEHHAAGRDVVLVSSGPDPKVAGETRTEAQIIVSDARVYAVDALVGRADGVPVKPRGTAYGLVNLNLPPEEAMKLMVSKSKGKLSLILKSKKQS